MVALDLCSGLSPGLDDVWIQRSLDEEIGVLDALCDLLEDPDEGLSDDLSLLLRVCDTRKSIEEGKTISGPLEETGVFPSMVVQIKMR